jgi:hypothetical protein
MEVADAVGAMISRAQPGRPLARRPAHAVAGPDRQRPEAERIYLKSGTCSAISGCRLADVVLSWQEHVRSRVTSAPVACWLKILGECLMACAVAGQHRRRSGACDFG